MLKITNKRRYERAKTAQRVTRRLAGHVSLEEEWRFDPISKTITYIGGEGGAFYACSDLTLEQLYSFGKTAVAFSSGPLPRHTDD